MSSPKEAKTAAKALKKSQKVAKKQQQQQQKTQIDITAKNMKNSTVAAATTGTGIGTTPATINNYGVNKLTGKTVRITPNKNNNNNNNMHNNNKSTNGSTSLSAPRVMLPVYEDAPKFERSSSFSLRGKLSKLINSITGSKENLTKPNEDDSGLTPYKFTRSRSMIMLRRSNRRSLIEPQLEQLSEETEKSSDPTSPASPRKNSLETEITEVTPKNAVSTQTLRRASAAQPVTSTPFEGSSTMMNMGRRGSTASLASVASSVGGGGEPYNPQLAFQKRRSSTLISSFKSTLSGIASGAAEKKKDKLNPKWSASLVSLQAIDNMVSYENMSFIDYDKFNGYEKQLERQLSTLSLSQATVPPPPQQYFQQSSVHSINDMPPPPPPAPRTPTSLTSLTIFANDTSPGSSATVVRRRKNRSSRNLSERSGGGSQRSSFVFDTDYEHNLDKRKNLYRYSLDSRKLELLNAFSRRSFIFDKHIVDVLNLEDGSIGRRRASAEVDSRTGDTLDGIGVVQVSDLLSVNLSFA